MNKIFVVLLFVAILGIYYSSADEDQLDLADLADFEKFGEVVKRANMVVGGNRRPMGKKRSSIRINGRMERLLASLISNEQQKLMA